MTVTRRGFVRGSTLLGCGAGLACLLAGRSAQAKIAPNLVAYQDTPNGDRNCANCVLFEPPDGCKSVDGKISPRGWCKLWLKKAT